MTSLRPAVIQAQNSTPVSLRFGTDIVHVRVPLPYRHPKLRRNVGQLQPHSLPPWPPIRLSGMIWGRAGACLATNSHNVALHFPQARPMETSRPFLYLPVGPWRFCNGYLGVSPDITLSLTLAIRVRLKDSDRRASRSVDDRGQDEHI